MWPVLRQDLALHPGPEATDGSPTWTLHDPASNRFFSLSWPAFELLSRWSLGSMEALIDAVHRETTLDVTPDDVEGLVTMLQANHLLVASRVADTERLTRQAQAMRLSPSQWLLKHYLFFRVPVLQPMRWLQRMSRWVRWAYQPSFWALTAGLTLLGLVLAARRWDEFTHTLTSYANWEGLLAIGIALSGAKVLHELGHAFTATHFGCRVPTMGVAFLVMWPVLYTDTNEAWKLTSRRQRLLIGGAGMMSEIALASVALLAWSLLPDTPGWAPIRSGAFLLATTTWLLTVTINASPFMRFDGYFLLSDAVNMPNLHERSFAIGRWWLRERLFGWGDPPPERFHPGRERALVVFAFATWLYRLVLFFGIALLVYHAFFKALGLVLLAVELGWFIARPIWREMSAWRQRGRFAWNRATRRSLLILGGVVLVLVWPWAESIRAPAVLAPLQVQTVAAAYASQVVGEVPREGRAVKAGDVLLQLRSPDLDMRLQQAALQEQQLQWQLSQQPFDDKLREAGPALRKQWEAAVSSVQGLREQRDQLVVRAPFDGWLAEVPEDLRSAAWIAPGERLLTVAGREGSRVDAYVDEAVLDALKLGQTGHFVPAALEKSGRSCRLTRVDPVQVATLDQPAAADVYGGGVAVHRRPEDGKLVPLRPTFHLRLEGCDEAATTLVREVPGTVHLQGERLPWVGRAVRWAAALWQRESAL